MPVRALSRIVEPRREPRRIEREVDLLKSETREATEEGRRVWPFEGEGRGPLRADVQTPLGMSEGACCR